MLHTPSFVELVRLTHVRALLGRYKFRGPSRSLVSYRSAFMVGLYPGGNMRGEPFGSPMNRHETEWHWIGIAIHYLGPKSRSETSPCVVTCEARAYIDVFAFRTLFIRDKR